MHFRNKTVDMVAVRMGQNPGGNVAVPDIFFQKRHIGLHAAVDDDSIILFGNDNERHHKWAGFG